eukprot:15324789-Ditylum_brightwellii.AAC.1
MSAAVLDRAIEIGWRSHSLLDGRGCFPQTKRSRGAIGSKRCEISVGRRFLVNIVDYHVLLAMRQEDLGRKIERVAARLTKPGTGSSYGLAKKMNIDIRNCIDRSYRENSDEVYCSISDGDDVIMGAVGNNPQTVCVALRTGTLHEQVAHCISFLNG